MDDFTSHIVFFYNICQIGGKIMKKTIIENRWMKMVNGNLCECKVFWHYIPNEQSTIFIQGYNPFPFFGKQGIKTTLRHINKFLEMKGLEKL